MNAACVYSEMALCGGVGMAVEFMASSRATTCTLEKQPQCAVAAQVPHHTVLSNLPVADTRQIKGD